MPAPGTSASFQVHVTSSSTPANDAGNDIRGRSEVYPDLPPDVEATTKDDDVASLEEQQRLLLLAEVHGQGQGGVVKDGQAASYSEEPSHPTGRTSKFDWDRTARSVPGGRQAQIDDDCNCSDPESWIPTVLIIILLLLIVLATGIIAYYFASAPGTVGVAASAAEIPADTDPFATFAQHAARVPELPQQDRQQARRDGQASRRTRPISAAPPDNAHTSNHVAPHPAPAPMSGFGRGTVVPCSRHCPAEDALEATRRLEKRELEDERIWHSEAAQLAREKDSMGFPDDELFSTDQDARGPRSSQTDQHALPDGTGALRADGMPARELSFRGYDCSVPYNLTAVTVDHSLTCSPVQMRKQQVPKKYILLQKSRRTRVNVQECIAIRSRLAYICANAGHSSLIPTESFFHEPYHMSPEQCKLAWTRGQFQRPHGSKNWYTRFIDKWYPGLQWEVFAGLKANRTVDFIWQRTGVTYTEDPGDIMCRGSKFYYERGLRSPGGKAVAAVVTDYLSISLHQREAFMFTDDLGNDKLLIDHNQLVLPCSVDREECVTVGGTGTFLWNEPLRSEHCPYHTIRVTEGVDIASNSLAAGETYLSTDNTMIRLRKMGRPLKRCGATILATEYPQLFLSEDLDHPEFHQDLPLSEGSTFLYANQKIHFVYDKLQDDLQTAVLAVRRDICQKDVNNRLRDYARKAAEQRSVTDGDTVHVGGNTFGTAEGEIWWLYKCRPLIVRARPTPGRCYDALPVTLRDEDLLRRLEDRRREQPEQDVKISEDEFAAARNLSNHGFGFFLEPKTHRLLTAAVASPCATHMPPVYRNRESRWISYNNGDFQSTPAPATLTTAMMNITFDRGQYFPEGGIYSGSSILEMESYHQARRLQQGLLGTFTRTWEKERGYNQDPEGNFLITDMPGMPSPTALAGINAMEWFWNLVEGYGTLCGLVVGTVILWKFACFCMGVTLRLCSVPQTPNLLVHVLGAFFPAITERLTRGLYKPKGAPGPCSEMASACCSNRDLGTPEGSEDDLTDQANLTRFQTRKNKRQAKAAYRKRRNAQYRQYRQEGEDRRAALALMDDLPPYRSNTIIRNAPVDVDVASGFEMRSQDDPSKQ